MSQNQFESTECFFFSSSNFGPTVSAVCIKTVRYLSHGQLVSARK